jgi:anaerobic selenocysteine-containing dehydrogenase
MLAEGRYDAAFIRDWSNGPFLVRDDTGRFLAAADIGGNAEQFVVWDSAAVRPVAYDSVAGRYVDEVKDPQLLGSVRVATSNGLVVCRPAFERYASLCREYPPERVARITGVPAAQIVETARRTRTPRRPFVRSRCSMR